MKLWIRNFIHGRFIFRNGHIIQFLWGISNYICTQEWIPRSEWGFRIGFRAIAWIHAVTPENLQEEDYQEFEI